MTEQWEPEGDSELTKTSEKERTSKARREQIQEGLPRARGVTVILYYGSSSYGNDGTTTAYGSLTRTD